MNTIKQLGLKLAGLTDEAIIAALVLVLELIFKMNSTLIIVILVFVFCDRQIARLVKHREKMNEMKSEHI